MNKRLTAFIVMVAIAMLFSATAFAGTIERMSVDSDGNQATQNSIASDISADGRYVVFASDAENLVPDDTNNVSDVFVHDRKTHTTERVSLGLENEELSVRSASPSISADGRYVAFGVGTINNYWYSKIYVRDLVTSQTVRVSKGVSGRGRNGFGPPKISGDGRYIVSRGATSSWNGDVLVFDRVTGTATIASKTRWGGYSNWAGHPKISANGQFVIFISTKNLVDPYPYLTGRILYIYDIVNDTIDYASLNLNGEKTGLNICGYGYDFDISGDGRYLTYRSYKYFLVYDRELNVVTQTDSGGCEPAFSDDGQTITYMAGKQIYALDRADGTVELISQNSDGVPGNGGNRIPSISEDGRFIAFYGTSTNLVPDDTNGKWDVFVYDRVGLPQSIEELIEYLEDLYDQGLITNHGVLNSLVSKLENAAKARDRGNTGAATNILIAVTNEVQAQSGKEIDAGEADTIGEVVQELISGL